jgi:hypothetical protein
MSAAASIEVLFNQCNICQYVSMMDGLGLNLDRSLSSISKLVFSFYELSSEDTSFYRSHVWVGRFLLCGTISSLNVNVIFSL